MVMQDTRLPDKYFHRTENELKHLGRISMVVFEKPLEVTSWYICEACGRSSAGLDWDFWNAETGGQCPVCLRTQNNQQTFAFPQTCNWQIVCEEPECEQSGCDLTDCCDAVMLWGRCPFDHHAALVPLTRTYEAAEEPTWERNPWGFNTEDWLTWFTAACQQNALWDWVDHVTYGTALKEEC